MFWGINVTDEQLADNYIAFIGECEEDDRCLERAIEMCNLMSVIRNRKLNPERPVPAEPDVSDKVRSNVGWWCEYYDTHGVMLNKEETMAAMTEELEYMRGVPVWQDLDPK